MLAKFMLYQALLSAGIKKVELARRLACSPSQVDRLLDINHKSRLDRLQAAFTALGKRLSFQVNDRAARKGAQSLYGQQLEMNSYRASPALVPSSARYRSKCGSGSACEFTSTRINW